MARLKSAEEKEIATGARRVWADLAHEVLEAQKKPMPSSRLTESVNAKLARWVESNIGQRESKPIEQSSRNRELDIYQPSYLRRRTFASGNRGVSPERLQAVLERDERFTMTGVDYPGRSNGYGYGRRAKHWALAGNVEKWAADEDAAIAASVARQEARKVRRAEIEERFAVENWGHGLTVVSHDGVVIASWSNKFFTRLNPEMQAKALIRQLVEEELNG